MHINNHQVLEDSFIFDQSFKLVTFPFHLFILKKLHKGKHQCKMFGHVQKYYRNKMKMSVMKTQADKDILFWYGVSW